VSSGSNSTPPSATRAERAANLSRIKSQVAAAAKAKEKAEAAAAAEEEEDEDDGELDTSTPGVINKPVAKKAKISASVAKSTISSKTVQSSRAAAGNIDVTAGLSAETLERMLAIENSMESIKKRQDEQAEANKQLQEEQRRHADSQSELSKSIARQSIHFATEFRSVMAGIQGLAEGQKQLGHALPPANTGAQHALPALLPAPSAHRPPTMVAHIIGSNGAATPLQSIPSYQPTHQPWLYNAADHTAPAAAPVPAAPAAAPPQYYAVDAATYASLMHQRRT
jgi:hypothetical protein